MYQERLRFRSALYWMAHDISEPDDKITFRVINNNNTLIITNMTTQSGYKLRKLKIELIEPYNVNTYYVKEK